jgi:hypothetical protein
MVEKRGRKSAADRQSADVVLFEPDGARPAPPPDLSEQEAQAWVEAVAVMPARHFDAGKRLVLRGYVRHIAAADLIWPQYEAALERGASAKELNALAKMFDRETDGVRHAARHLGLLAVMRHGKYVPRYQARAWEL